MPEQHKPEGEGPSIEEKLSALADAVGALVKRVDAISKRHEEDRDDDDDRRDARGQHEGEDEEEDEEHRRDHRGRRADRRRADDEDDKRSDSGEGVEPEPLAAGGAPTALHHTRADRQRERERDKLALAQVDFDRVFGAVHGTRAPRPLDGEPARTYRTRLLRSIQSYSPDYKSIDLKKLSNDAFELADRVIRADAFRVGCDPSLMQQFVPSGRLREIRREDRTGRMISEFVGPVSETLAPFRFPPQRVKKINTQPGPGY